MLNFLASDLDQMDRALEHIEKNGAPKRISDGVRDRSFGSRSALNVNSRGILLRSPIGVNISHPYSASAASSISEKSALELPEAR